MLCVELVKMMDGNQLNRFRDRIARMRSDRLSGDLPVNHAELKMAGRVCTRGKVKNDWNGLLRLDIRILNLALLKTSSLKIQE